MHRLLRDGVRGFYIVSMVTGRQRWIHPREAALLCGLNPSMKFPDDLRAGLCLVGQCASPLQATWMGAHLLAAVNGAQETPAAMLRLHKMWLLRQAHGMVPKRVQGGLQVQDAHDGSTINMNLSATTKVIEILEAERRLQGGGTFRALVDLYGRLPDGYDITHGAVTGELLLEHRDKRQKKVMDDKMITVEVATVRADGDSIQRKYIAKAGTFVFEILQSLPGVDHVYYRRIYDDQGHEWRLDDRIFNNVLFVQFHHHFDLCAFGPAVPGEQGLGNECIDKWARRMLAEMQQTGASTWIPALQLSLLVQHTQDVMLNHWLVAALHGPLRGCAVLEGHWILLEMKVTGNTLTVTCWDGLDHQHRHQIWLFAEMARQILVVRTLVVSFNAEFSQMEPHTCGTVALLHLGHAIGYWDQNDVPEETEWHAGLLASNCGHFFGRGRHEDEEQLVIELRDILHHHGVPMEKTEERAHLALKKMGAAAIGAALQSRNSWAALKALGSSPKFNFLWVKPDELEKQIRFRAHSKYKASVSEKKKDQPHRMIQKANMDPKALGLVEGTFVAEDGRELRQLDIENVAADKCGVAFGSLEDVAPFLREDKSITMDSLAIITTCPVPPASQGLMPVCNLRFPAIYLPTKEIVLIEGSIVQLGDCSVIRRQEERVASLQPIDTRTFKFVVWQDEWPHKWSEFTVAPVKRIMEAMPRLLLCKGDRCGPGCERFHAPVDCDLDQVVVDLWNRGWYGVKGKRSTPDEAEQFQVHMRIPCVCTDGLQSRSGQDGIYIEPRRTDGKGPAEEFAVIWLNSTDKQDAMHKLKVSDRGVALVRFGGRYGIRVLCRDAEGFHKEIYPDKPFQQIQVHSVYELRHLPYGIQTAGVRELLKQWGWKARVLQPYKADQHGQGWLVGAETAPPANVFQTNNGDVLVTMHKKQEAERTEPIILASAKTKTFLKKAPARKQAAGSQDKENVMPWNGLDPWGGYNKFQDGVEPDAQMTRSTKLERLQSQMHEVVETSLKDATEQRFQKLETGITELREQNQKFETWFGEAGQSTAALRQDVSVLTGQVRENQQNISTLSGEIRSGFANLEALLAKKQRQE